MTYLSQHDTIRDHSLISVVDVFVSALLCAVGHMFGKTTAIFSISQANRGIGVHSLTLPVCILVHRCVLGMCDHNSVKRGGINYLFIPFSHKQFCVTFPQLGRLWSSYVVRVIRSEVKLHISRNISRL